MLWIVVKQSKFDDFVMKPVVIEDVDAIIIELVGEESIGDKELAEEDDENEDLQSYVQRTLGLYYLTDMTMLSSSQAKKM